MTRVIYIPGVSAKHPLSIAAVCDQKGIALRVYRGWRDAHDIGQLTMRRISDEVGAMLSGPTAVVGKSFGGGVALLLEDARIKARVLLAPAVRIGTPTPQDILLAHIDTLTAMPKAVPTLIIHAQDDDVVPLENSRRLADAIGAELLIMEEGKHSLQQPEVAEAAVAFILRHA